MGETQLRCAISDRPIQVGEDCLIIPVLQEESLMRSSFSLKELDTLGTNAHSMGLLFKSTCVEAGKLQLNTSDLNIMDVLSLYRSLYLQHGGLSGGGDKVSVKLYLDSKAPLIVSKIAWPFPLSFKVEENPKEFYDQFHSAWRYVEDAALARQIVMTSQEGKPLTLRFVYVLASEAKSVLRRVKRELGSKKAALTLKDYFLNVIHGFKKDKGFDIEAFREIYDPNPMSSCELFQSRIYSLEYALFNSLFKGGTSLFPAESLRPLRRYVIYWLGEEMSDLSMLNVLRSRLMLMFLVWGMEMDCVE